MKDHRLVDERSLAFDKLTAKKLVDDPSLLHKASANIERWLASCSPQVRPVLLEWQQILERPLEEIGLIPLAQDQRAQRLRQSSPFAGVLTREERTAILKEYWIRESIPA